MDIIHKKQVDLLTGIHCWIREVLLNYEVKHIGLVGIYVLIMLNFRCAENMFMFGLSVLYLRNANVVSE